VLVGNLKLLKNLDIGYDPVIETIDDTVVVVAVGSYGWLITLQMKLKRMRLKRYRLYITAY
jgi:hypothetical protein